jgi:uncharacterized membrane protein YphA (DoxX/SURF4 family)
MEGSPATAESHILNSNELKMGAPGRYALQRLFSTFPGGRPGMGLLVLRAAVGLTAFVAGVLSFSTASATGWESWLLGAVLTISGAALAIGLLTPMAGPLVAACFLGIAVSWLPAPSWGLQDTRAIAVAMIISATAISLLGPGAFSLDGRLFGRREIVIPPSSRPPES